MADIEYGPFTVAPGYAVSEVLLYDPDQSKNVYVERDMGVVYSSFIIVPCGTLIDAFVAAPTYIVSSFDEPGGVYNNIEFHVDAAPEVMPSEIW